MRTRSAKARWLLASLSLPFLASTATAQEADARWQRNNDRGNRYEGRVEIPVGRPQLEALSFLGHRESYSGSTELRVRFFLPASGDVSIVARELTERVNYWMEAKPQSWKAGSWNEFGPWPTQDVLSREQVPAGNLGVLIRLQQGGKTVLAPAFVYHSSKPTAVDTYTLHLRPDSHLRGMSYRLFQGSSQLHEGEVVDRITAGKAFAIRLQAKGLPSGVLRLEVEGQFKDRAGGPKESFNFHHQPL